MKAAAIPILHTGQVYGYWRIGFLTAPWSGQQSRYAVTYTCCGHTTEVTHEAIQWMKKRPAQCCRACFLGRARPAGPVTGVVRAPAVQPLTLAQERAAQAQRVAAARAATEARLARIRAGLLPSVARQGAR